MAPPASSPFFSIVVPCYNRADIVRETVMTILKQEYQEFELILVDDGSRDNTGEVIARITDPRVRYFYKVRWSGRNGHGESNFPLSWKQKNQPSNGSERSMMRPFGLKQCAA